MNYRMVWQVIGRVLCIEAGLLALPMLAALFYGEAPTPFLLSAAVTGAAGLALWKLPARRTELTAREGFLIVGLSWALMAVFGALPFVFTGDIPNYLDALFEAVSGLTTTGATLLPNIETLSRGGMFWYLFMQWIGGMGILVFILAVLPMAGNRSMHIMRAEVPGPTVGKLVPRVRKTARILYLLYIFMTALEAALLMLSGMSFYDALLHAFTTAGTGGLSTRALSIGYYNSAYIDMVVATFMVLFGVNFSLYFLMLMGDVRQALRNEELRWYLLILAFAVATIAWSLGDRYGGFVQALRYAYFQAAACMSTTGFFTADFAQWPQYAQALLVLLMFIGGCAGSTSGGLKLSRIMILLKAAVTEFKRMLRPRCVEQVRLDGKPIERETVHRVLSYFALYALIIMASTVVVSLDGYDFTTSLTASLACMSNIGPGLGAVGPLGSYAGFSLLSRTVLALEMLLGRLEVFPILLLFVPSLWRRK